MIEQLEYIPGLGGAPIQLNCKTAVAGSALGLRSREWERVLGYRNLVSATRPAREVAANLVSDYETANTVRRVADADVAARIPGTFVFGNEWRQHGYILASQPSKAAGGWVSVELTIALLDGAWWRLVSKEFLPEETPVTEYASATGEIVNVAGAVETPLHALTIYGKSVQDGTPTPSAPVPIQVVEAKNLQTWPTSGTFSTLGASIQHNATFIDTITIASSTTGNVWGLDSAERPGCTAIVPAGTYTASCTPGFRIMIRKYENGSWSNLYSNVSTPYTFTLEEETEVQVMYSVPNGTTAGTYSGWVQLEKGSEATTYTPYKRISLDVDGTITPIDLDGNVLASLPDGTCDELNIDSDGAVTITKRVGSYIVTGNETVSGTTQFTSVRRVVLSSVVTSENSCTVFGDSHGICTHAPYENTTGQGSGVHVAMNNRNLALFEVGDDASTVVAKYVGATIYYNLATEQTISLGSITMPNVEDGSYVKVIASMTPTITAEWALTSEFFLDYPHNYPYDYKKTSSTESVTPSVLTPSDVHLVIYGPAVNPYVIVGGNKYQVNVTVPSGGYLTVDGRDKTIKLTLADGTVQNAFSYGVRGGGAGGGSYIFEPVSSGGQDVAWDGTFGFDFGWYEEEGEPPWNQS